MTKSEYRIKHSELIENCIYIEDILKRFYGIANDKGDLDKFIKITDELDNDPMGKLINLYKKNNNCGLPNDFIEKLDKVREIRNYYVHRVFYQNNPFNYKVADSVDALKINESLMFVQNVYSDFCVFFDEKQARTKIK